MFERKEEVTVVANDYGEEVTEDVEEKQEEDEKKRG